MYKFKLWAGLSLGILLTLAGNRAQALPGQTTDKVISWINANPTLRPGAGDGLIVRNSSTAAQRFNFEASVLPPGRITFPKDKSAVRTESLHIFDMINGVTRDRLKESLRTIYGLDIYQDFERGTVVYSYPSPETVDQARRQRLPLLEAQQGELRLGDRYAYWMEVVPTKSGKAFNGQVTVFLKEDLNKLQTELLGR
jgi:hypothetical protein